MKKYYIASFSGGKDSTAMVLHLLELGEPLDEVLFCDTTKEFPDMYQHIEKVKKVIEDKGVKFTVLSNNYDFDYYLIDYVVKRRKPEEFKAKHGDANGLAWPSSRVRWCTEKYKRTPIDKYINNLKKQYEVFQYIGLAADETKRLERANNKKENHVHPLAEWGWTEKDCLDYCYSLGYDWNGLYEHFDRVSCWCCPLKKLGELRNLRKYYPKLWQELLEMDSKTWGDFRNDFTLPELNLRFAFEEERLAENKSVRNREFFKELRERIKNEL